MIFIRVPFCDMENLNKIGCCWKWEWISIFGNFGISTPRGQMFDINPVNLHFAMELDAILHLFQVDSVKQFYYRSLVFDWHAEFFLNDIK